MAKFLDQLNLTELDDTIFQIADHEFRYHTEACGGPFGELITVPVGFKTDFASVPRIGLIYAFLGDTAHEPAVIHDYLYYAGTHTRADADAVLMEAMGVIGMPAWRRYPIYWGVRIGGWVAWNAHRKAGDSEKDFEPTVAA